MHAPRRLGSLVLACVLASPLAAQPASRVPPAAGNGVAPLADLPQGGATLFEPFDSVPGSPNGCPPGWTCANRSSPAGTTGWFQGAPVVFPAQAGAPDAYIAANFSNGGGLATISNWLISPEVAFYPGNSLRFWTRTVGNSVFADRLEIRVSTAGASTDVGSTANGVGDFDQLVYAVNPGLVPPGPCPPTPNGGYPSSWCEFTVGADDGLPTSGRGRIAFRYFLPNAGPNGFNGDYIGIDSVLYFEGDAPADVALDLSTDGTAQTEPGDRVRLSAVVRALGPGDASDVRAILELSSLLTYVADDCGASQGEQGLLWSPGTLLPGEQVTCTVEARLLQRGEVVSVASVTALENDPVPANNRAIAGFASAVSIPATGRPALAALALAALTAGLAGARARRTSA